MEQRSDWTPDLPTILATLDSPWAKELAWAVGSQPLMSPTARQTRDHWGADTIEAVRSELNDAACLARLEAWAEGGLHLASNRLGHRFERLVQTWFELHPDWKVHAANAVVQGPDRTWGEMDLLLESGSRWVHLELACKFYLASDQSPTSKDAHPWRQWIGVDPKDRLDSKIRTFERQLDLTRQPFVSQWLDERNWRVDERKAWMKGWFFHHFAQLNTASPPAHASPKYPSGWWCRVGDWPGIWSSHTHWIAVKPEHWIRPHHPFEDVVPLHHADDFSPMWDGKRGALLVCAAEPLNGQWVEQSRGMVVPDSWPNGK